MSEALSAFGLCKLCCLLCKHPEWPEATGVVGCVHWRILKDTLLLCLNGTKTSPVHLGWRTCSMVSATEKPLEFSEQMDRMNSGWKSMWFSRFIEVSDTPLFLHWLFYMCNRMTFLKFKWSIFSFFFLAHWTLINLSGCPCSVMAWYSKNQRIKNSKNSVKWEGLVYIDNCWERIHGKRKKILGVPRWLSC